MGAIQQLQRINEEVDQKRAALADLFAKNKNDEGFTFNADQLSEVNKRNDELNDLVKKQAEIQKLYLAEEDNRKAMEARAEEQKRSAPAQEGQERKSYGLDSNAAMMGAQRKSIGEMVVESKAYTERKANVQATLPDADFKTVMSSGLDGQAAAGWQPQSLRTGKELLSAQESPRVVDLFPVTETQYPLVKYMEETTFTNNAAETAESYDGNLQSYPESALALTEKSAPVEKIATYIPVSDEQLEDITRIRDYINNRLTFMVQQKLDKELILGDGSQPHLRGLAWVLAQSGSLSQAKGSDAGPDAIYKAMTQIRTNAFTMADGIIMHPSDWQNIRLLRTTGGLYIWGNPSEVGADRIWGLPVVQTTFMTATNAWVGAFREYSEISHRRGIDIQISNSHASFFIQGVQAIRIDMRLASLFYRVTAFCKVTGL